MKKKYIIEVDESEVIEYWSELGVKEIGYQEYALKSCFNGKVKPYEERPQGECKSCRHRDPEDKKCDCGALERQGCPFPVGDDYYCKYYEKGSAENE